MDKDLEFVREKLREASEVKDPRDMWYVVRDLFNLLTTIVVNKPEKIEDPDIDGVFIVPG